MNTSSILTKLKHVSSKSGIEFLDLSDNFPLLVEELDSTINTQSKLDTFENILSDLNIVVKKQADLLNKNKLFLEDVKNKNNELFRGITEKMDLLNSMQEIILGIKDESENMGVISLNAMVVSIRSGREGQAFSYITANLKQSSKRLIKQSDVLIKTEDAVQNLLKQLESSIMQVLDLNKQTESQEKLDNSQVIEIASAISTALKEMLQKAKSVKQPIIKAMEGIQIQDIIRQSLDDILLALSKIKSVDSTFSPEEQLEIVCTNSKLLQLSLTCLDGVETNIAKSIETFKSNRDEVNAILKDVDNNRQYFLPAVVNSKQNTSSRLYLLKECIDETVQNFESFIELIMAYKMIQRNVLESVTQIQHSVMEMSACFTSFQPIIENLQYVAIAQRIEVARNEAIASIKDTVEQMADLIDETQENVNTAQIQLQEFTDACNVKIKRFLETSNQDAKTFENVNMSKSLFSKELNKFYNDLENFALDFNVYSDDFFTYYNKISASIDTLIELQDYIKSAKSELQSLLAQSDEQKNDLIATHNLNEDEIHNQEILGFLDKFTITAHKLAVGNIEGVSVNSGASAGDITFF